MKPTQTSYVLIQPVLGAIRAYLTFTWDNQGLGCYVQDQQTCLLPFAFIFSPVNAIYLVNRVDLTDFLMWSSLAQAVAARNL